MNIDAILHDALERFQEMSDRVILDDLEWYAFPQAWGSTALGFPGAGGMTMTRAQTVVVWERQILNRACVYFGGRLAYVVNDPREKFQQALSGFSMPPRWEKGRVEGND